MLLLSILTACTPEPTPSTTAPAAPAPDYGLFIADGVVDTLAPGYAPRDFDAFFVEHFGHSDAEIEAERDAARAFFEDGYGLDVDTLVADKRVQWVELRLDVEANYRVRALPGRHVPPEGWLVDDLAFGVIVTDPAGVELGGPYEGLVAGPGPLAVYGYYVFDADGETIVIAYQSDGVAATSLDGRYLFYCAMESEQLGSGLGRITSEYAQLADGSLLHDFVNVQDWDL